MIHAAEIVLWRCQRARHPVSFAASVAVVLPARPPSSLVCRFGGSGVATEAAIQSRLPLRWQWQVRVEQRALTSKAQPALRAAWSDSAERLRSRAAHRSRPHARRALPPTRAFSLVRRLRGSGGATEAGIQSRSAPPWQWRLRAQPRALTSKAELAFRADCCDSAEQLRSRAAQGRQRRAPNTRAPSNCAPSKNRTCDQRFRKPLPSRFMS